MFLFLSTIMLFSSVALKHLDSVPIYENPVIVKSNQLTGGRRAAKVSLSSQQLRASRLGANFAGQKQGLRNQLTRGFNLKNLNNWVDHLSKEKINTLSNDATRQNLGDIKVMSINMQKYIHSTCGKLSELLKLLDLKLKEVNTISLRITTIKPGKARKVIKGVKAKEVKLKKALAKEKAIVEKVMKEVQAKQKSLIKVLEIYDKGFVKKSRSQVQVLLSQINAELNKYMTLPYFKSAYQAFMAYVLGVVKGFSPAQLNNFQATAKALVGKHFKRFLEKAKKEWEKTKKGKKARKSKKNKKAKKGPIRKIK